MLWLLTVFAYLLGSLSFAIVLCRLAKCPDPRHAGSNNPGASNVLRIAGKQLALWTLLGDFSKGLLPVVVAAKLELSPQQQAWVGFGAFIGHLYPVFFSFSGGKGVATAAGVLFGLYPPTACLATIGWLTCFMLSRVSSLSAMVAIPLCFPLLVWQHPEALLPVSLMASLLIWRHRNNLHDLMHGRERSFKKL